MSAEPHPNPSTNAYARNLRIRQNRITREVQSMAVEASPRMAFYRPMSKTELGRKGERDRGAAQGWDGSHASGAASRWTTDFSVCGERPLEAVVCRVVEGRVFSCLAGVKGNLFVGRCGNG